MKNLKKIFDVKAEKETYRSHECAQYSITLIALRASSTSSGPWSVDTINPGTKATASIVDQAFVQVITVKTVACVAGWAGTTSEQIKKDKFVTCFKTCETTLSEFNKTGLQPASKTVGPFLGFLTGQKRNFF